MLALEHQVSPPVLGCLRRDDRVARDGAYQCAGALVTLQFSAPHCTTTACESESGMLDPACALLEAASPAPPSSRANAKPHLVRATFGKPTRRVRADSWRADPERFGLLFHRLALEDRRSITSAAAQSNGRFRCAARGPRAGGRATADKDGSRKRHS